MKNYITKSGEVTDLFREELKTGIIPPLPDELAPLTDAIYKRVQSIYDSKALDDMIDNGSKPQTPANTLNDNFSKRSFRNCGNVLITNMLIKYRSTVKNL